MEKSLKLTVSVTLDGVNFEEKPFNLFFRPEDGGLMLLSEDHKMSLFFYASALAELFSDAHGMIAPKTNRDIQKVLDSAEKLFYRKKIEDLEAKVEG
nr:MAG TPA: hypothetical protein [Caudoviricetes sp.]DAO90028.1 MAG TPA: hypothetical protein [Caudoviricetes sp.]